MIMLVMPAVITMFIMLNLTRSSYCQYPPCSLHSCCRYKSWKRRWFILNDNCLYYFEFTTDKEPRGIIPLENISVGRPDPQIGILDYS